MSDQDRDDTTRRRFIGNVAAAGLGLSVAPAAISADARLQIRRRPTLAVRNQGMSFETVPTLARGVAQQEPDAPPPDLGEVAEYDLLSPTPRNELIHAISSSRAGASLLSDLGVAATGDGAQAPQYSLSGHWKSRLRVSGNILAEAYASATGIRLEASGEISWTGLVPDTPPLEYWTYRGWASSKHRPPSADWVACRLSSSDSVDASLLHFRIRTPGDSKDLRTYSLEMDLRENVGDGRQRLDCSSSVGPVTWSRTSRDTIVALIKLGGTNGSPDNWLTFRRRFKWIPCYGEFRWLNVMAL